GSRISMRLNDGVHTLDPHALIPIEWPAELHIQSEEPLYAYQSWRDSAGSTQFFWPEQQP
ncbi:MAG TPA: hypothetical protein VFT12_09760, partial [Thermoanaerobaculia bacterium]|nr:hypothetical protein [Thermoanaerobaculia bacterium]